MVNDYLVYGYESKKNSKRYSSSEQLVIIKGDLIVCRTTISELFEIPTHECIQASYSFGVITFTYGSYDYAIRCKTTEYDIMFEEDYKLVFDK